jgi:hypothetical protein
VPTGDVVKAPAQAGCLAIRTRGRCTGIDAPDGRRRRTGRRAGARCAPAGRRSTDTTSRLHGTAP